MVDKKKKKQISGYLPNCSPGFKKSTSPLSAQESSVGARKIAVEGIHLFYIGLLKVSNVKCKGLNFCFSS